MRQPYSVLLPVLALLFVFTSGCDNSGDGGTPNTEAASRNLTPADTALAGTYNRSCRNCHTIAATGAPLTGDIAAWDALLTEKGIDTLVDNVITGVGRMPALGMCMDCDADQFQALIEFMASGE